MNIKRIFAALLCMTLLFHCGAGLASDAYEGTGFELIETKQADDFGGTIYYFRHRKTGAQVVYLDNGSERRDFFHWLSYTAHRQQRSQSCAGAQSALWQ